MKFFDTHIHLDATEFDTDRELVWQRAQRSGVNFGVNVGAFPERWEKIRAISQQLPGIIPGIGLHPMVTGEIDETSLHQMQQLLQQHHFMIIGEMGLDSLYSHCPIATQEKYFRAQLAFSLQFDLPIALHIRKLHQRVLDILAEFGRKEWSGIAHCFSGSLEQAQAFIKRGFFISLAGPVTNPNARKLKRTAAALPLDRLVVETDSPDLPPRHLNASRNEPAFVIEVVKALAKIRSEPLEKVAEQVYRNACHLFNLDRT